MNWKDIAGAVGNAAPVIGGLLAGPLGAQAGSLLARGLGVSETPDDVARVIQGDPEAMVKIKTIESTERTRLQEIASEETKARWAADNADRDSARRRQETLHDITPTILACTITIGFFGVLIFSIVHGLPEKGGDAILVLLGALSTAWAAVVGYYFGSSASSAKAQDRLARTTGSV